jgi:hypothetical protein
VSCAVKVGAYNINLRQQPATGTPVIGRAGAGTVQTVYEWHEADPYLWAYNGTGWFVTRQIDWWVFGIEGQTERCVDVLGWPGDLVPPVPIVQEPQQTAFLIHVEVGASADELAQMYSIMDAHGVVSGVKAVNTLDLCAHALAYGQVCVMRDLISGDCPNVLAADPVAEAARWLRLIEPRVLPTGLRPDYIEPMNECNHDDLAWWNAFMLEAVRLAALWDWPPLIVPSLAPGHGDSAMITAWRSALAALGDAGGCFGMHAYSIDNAMGLADGDIWTAYRHRLLRAQLVGAGLGDLDICITEAAAGDGYQPPDLDDFAAWYGTVKDDPHLRLVAAYHAGLGRGALSDLRGRLVELARTILPLLHIHDVIIK